MHAITVFFVALAMGDGPNQTAEPLVVSSVLLSAVEDAEIAAREAGAIVALESQRGATLAQGAVVAQIDDAEAELARERVAIELEIARERAANDVSIRHAQKTLEVAQAELERARAAVEKYPQSISDREMARLRLTVERDRLAIEQSEHEHRITQAGLRLKEAEFKLATLRYARRKVTAPFAGIVAEALRSRGEWVEPGDTIVRLLRIDRLRAEGFVDASFADASLLGRPVELSLEHADGTTGSYEGEVVFVSPEIDPVNGQVLVWAEIENRGLTLRPGLKAEMKIDRSLNPAGR